MSELTKQMSAVVAVLTPKLEPVISALLVNQPHWQMAFHQAIGLYGYYMAIKQEEVNEFVNFLKSNPDKFRAEVVNSAEFQNGFVQSLRAYLEARTIEKKDVVKNILIGFSMEDDKNNFELERLNAVLLQVSTQGIAKLIFIQQVIIPYKESSIRREIETIRPSDPKAWFETTSKREPIWKYVYTWINENYDPNSEKVKREAGVIEWEGKVPQHTWDKEQEITREFQDAVEEFVSLGIMRMQVISEGFVAAPSTTYNFTSFGLTFVSYLNNLYQD